MSDNALVTSKETPARTSQLSHGAKTVLLATSVLHIIIGVSFILFPSSMSVEHLNSILAMEVVSRTWGLLFGGSGLLGLTIFLLNNQSIYWLAHTFFASVCGMWAMVAIFIFATGHVDFARIAVWAYFTLLHIQRARYRQFDYTKAENLLAQMIELRDKTAATTISQAVSCENDEKSA